jgi:two-component system, LytTR family, response regulator
VQPIRTLIVDDEPAAREGMRHLLAGDREVVLAGVCANGREAAAAIAAAAPDLVFLDVQMPELDGFGLLRRLDRASLPAVVFVTAHEQYALRAFEVHAVDYLLKPFSGERFRTALARARDRIAAHAGDEPLARLAAAVRRRPMYLTRIPVRSGGRTIVVDLTAVDWIEAADNYVRLHVRQREFVVRDTLGSIEAQLDPDRFVRIHRSTIVQIDRVLEIAPTTHGDAALRLTDGTGLAVSRTWRERLRQAITAGRQA